MEETAVHSHPQSGKNFLSQIQKITEEGRKKRKDARRKARAKLLRSFYRECRQTVAHEVELIERRITRYAQDGKNVYFRPFSIHHKKLYENRSSIDSVPHLLLSKNKARKEKVISNYLDLDFIDSRYAYLMNKRVYYEIALHFLNKNLSVYDGTAEIYLDPDYARSHNYKLNVEIHLLVIRW
ncbi:MAG: hypothetical protein WD335_02450 [Candidatus Paceibacterota bacterium]